MTTPTTTALERLIAQLRRVMVGSEYIWEPENRENPRAYARVIVDSIDHNGEELIVTSHDVRKPAEKCVNSFTRFMEAISTKLSGRR